MSRPFDLLFYTWHTLIFQFIKGNCQLLHNTCVSKVHRRFGKKEAQKPYKRKALKTYYLAFHTINIRGCGSFFVSGWQTICQSFQSATISYIRRLWMQNFLISFFCISTSIHLSEGSQTTTLQEVRHSCRATLIGRWLAGIVKSQSNETP